MRNTAYRYNPETCQYEHASLRVKDFISYCLGVLIVAALLCFGLIIAYDRFTETELETTLRKENRALDKHQVLLVNHLSTVESTLGKLKEKDQSIYQKLFEETSVEISSASSADKKAVLLADASDFNKMLNDLTVKSEDVYDRSLRTNEYFNGRMRISKKDQIILNSIPTLQPIANPNLDLLVSGYGTRINPFHKGKYKHPGIDFAAPRGTEVFAAATGSVIHINRSNLQAGYGNSIDIDHGNGFVTRYSHLEEITVNAGQRITKGMIIGTVGNSGGSIAPHVHYEVILHGDTVDPMAYMIEGLDSHAYNRLTSLSKKQNQSLD
jgi:murein DD-endopeptidase MepM/ murein hydrolase activator NlpD